MIPRGLGNIEENCRIDHYSGQSSNTKESCSSTSLNRCTSTETRWNKKSCLSLVASRAEVMGIDNGGWGNLTPWKYVALGQSMRWPPKTSRSFFHSELLVDNSASFTSCRMKDLRTPTQMMLLFRTIHENWLLCLCSCRRALKCSVLLWLAYS